CSGMSGVNPNFDALRGDLPVWKAPSISNEYVEPIQNTAKGLNAIATFTTDKGVEKIEFSMFKQNPVLTTTEDTGDETITRKATYPTLELRGIVGDYPMLYNFVDENRKIQGVAGTSNKNLADIDISITSGDEVIRGFNFVNCRATDYVVATDANTEESYVKNKFALENIFDFECQGYHPNNPAYDAMFNVEKSNTESSSDLRNTDQWGAGFTVQK
ncbi:MAG: hypothetical protein ACE5RP_07635, partial [Nitrosopumilus sp.]